MRLINIFLIILGVAALASLAVAGFLLLGLNDEAWVSKYLPLSLEFLKVITIGLFVTLASILIPYLFQERKYEFEMRKEAKKIYSESLTGVMYLSSRLPYLKLAEDAFKHLEDLHWKKHLAETYYEHLEVKNENAEFEQRRIWPPNLDPGERIEETKLKVMKIANNWSDMSDKVRFDYFNNR